LSERLADTRYRRASRQPFQLQRKDRVLEEFSGAALAAVLHISMTGKLANYPLSPAEPLLQARSSE